MGGRTKGGEKKNRNGKLSLNSPTAKINKKKQKKLILISSRLARQAKKKHIRLNCFIIYFVFLLRLGNICSKCWVNCSSDLKKKIF